VYIDKRKAKAESGNTPTFFNEKKRGRRLALDPGKEREEKTEEKSAQDQTPCQPTNPRCTQPFFLSA